MGVRTYRLFAFAKGIRAENQRLHKDSLLEIATWLANHPNDLVVIYTDIGMEVSTYSQLDALLALYTRTFGNLVFSPSDFKNAGRDWNTLTLKELIVQRKQIILLSTRQANDQMFSMYELCAGWTNVSSTSLSGKTKTTDTLVRAYKSALHYGTLSEGALRASTSNINRVETPSVDADNLNATTLPVFMNAGVNILSPDGLDGTIMAALVWSWAEKEPDVNTATAVHLSAIDGRWYGVANSSSISHVACVSSLNRMSWEVVKRGAKCSHGFEIGVPHLAIENTALIKILQAQANDATARLDVDLAAIPAIFDVEDTDEDDENTVSALMVSVGVVGIALTMACWMSEV